MKHSGHSGFSAIFIPLVITVGLLAGGAGFAGWAFLQMLDYKNNVGQHITTAVALAKVAEDKVKDADFAQQAKSPYRTYTGPSAYGSLTIKYPNTWSGYVIDTNPSSPFVDGYFYPGVVPDSQSPSSSFALRVQLVQDSYSNVLNGLSGYVQRGATQVQPYKLPLVPSVIGSRITGSIGDSKTGTMIVLPLRNTTLKLWTEAPQFQSDFDSIILANFSFAP